MSTISDKERELLKSYHVLLDHCENCPECRRKIEEILQHIIAESRKNMRSDVLKILGTSVNRRNQRK